MGDQRLQVAEVVQEHSPALLAHRRDDRNPAPDRLDARQPIALVLEAPDENITPLENLEHLRVRNLFQHGNPVAPLQHFGSVVVVAHESAINQDEPDVFAALAPNPLDRLSHVGETVTRDEHARRYHTPAVLREVELYLARQLGAEFTVRYREQGVNCTNVLPHADPVPQKFVDALVDHRELVNQTNGQPEEQFPQETEAGVPRRERAVVHDFDPLKTQHEFQERPQRNHERIRILDEKIERVDDSGLESFL